MPASSVPPPDFGLVQLPPPTQRQVLQHWRMVEPPGKFFRSIEIVGASFYMVIRGIDDEGNSFGGTHGFLLIREGPTAYRQASKGTMHYRITETGELLGTTPGDEQPTMRCVPVNEPLDSAPGAA